MVWNKDDYTALIFISVIIIIGIVIAWILLGGKPASINTIFPFK